VGDWCMKVAVIGGYGPSLINFRGPMLRAMKNAGHDVYGIAPTDSPDVPEKLAEMGIKFIEAPIKRKGMNAAKDLAALIALVKILKEIKPDVVISYTIKPIIYGSIAAKLTGTKKNLFHNHRPWLRFWTNIRQTRIALQAGQKHVPCRACLQPHCNVSKSG
ncbi:hypothetical protein ADUPG1_003356, partial [Aduncisulcus paluster]